MALTKKGNVYSWGNNEYGQLDIGNNEESDTPRLIKLNNFFINKISCSHFKSFLLSCDGVIYTVGNNFSRQKQIRHKRI
jgi:alpha-tubulin suppressor-like RCC1 family protein